MGLAMATACDLKRSHAFPTRVFENYNNGQFEDFNDAFHRDSLEWVNGNSANGLFSGATSVSDIQAIDAALGNPTFTLDSVTKKSDSESAFYGSFAGFAFSGFFEYHHCRISPRGSGLKPTVLPLLSLTRSPRSTTAKASARRN